MPRGRVWDDTNINSSLTSGTGVVLQLVNQDIKDLTSVRVVARLKFQPASVSATNQGQMLCDVGIGIASLDAFNVGITAIPDVTNTAAFPPRGWVWKSKLFCAMENNTGSVEFVKEDVLDIDIRAMRKLDRGILYLTAETNGISGTPFATRLIGLVRVLCLL